MSRLVRLLIGKNDSQLTSLECHDLAFAFEKLAVEFRKNSRGISDIIKDLPVLTSQQVKLN
jgi:hypothetical protein